jgi:hypothetical protein
MTTTVLHANVQRDRFTQHAVAALASLIPAALRLALKAARPVPALTPPESAAVEAQKVRDLARSYAKTDPGFSADLYAAAARHEGLYAD